LPEVAAQAQAIATDEAATAYSGRAAKFYWIAEPVWDNPIDDSRCIAWGRNAGRRMAAMSQAGNYLNEQADTRQGCLIRRLRRRKIQPPCSA
jgi:hypothetical protein